MAALALEDSCDLRTIRCCPYHRFLAQKSAFLAFIRAIVSFVLTLKALPAIASGCGAQGGQEGSADVFDIDDGPPGRAIGLEQDPPVAIAQATKLFSTKSRRSCGDIPYAVAGRMWGRLHIVKISIAVLRDHGRRLRKSCEVRDYRDPPTSARQPLTMEANARFQATAVAGVSDQ